MIVLKLHFSSDGKFNSLGVMLLQISLYLIFLTKIYAPELESVNILIEEISNHPLAYIPRVRNPTEVSQCDFLFHGSSWPSELNNRVNYYTNEEDPGFERTVIYKQTYYFEETNGRRSPRYKNLYVEIPDVGFSRLADTSKCCI